MHRVLVPDHEPDRAPPLAVTPPVPVGGAPPAAPGVPLEPQPIAESIVRLAAEMARRERYRALAEILVRGICPFVTQPGAIEETTPLSLTGDDRSVAPIALTTLPAHRSIAVANFSARAGDESVASSLAMDWIGSLEVRGPPHENPKSKTGHGRSDSLPARYDSVPGMCTGSARWRFGRLRRCRRRGGHAERVGGCDERIRRDAERHGWRRQCCDRWVRRERWGRRRLGWRGKRG